MSRFTKLQYQAPNQYFTTNKHPFVGTPIAGIDVQSAFDFAYDMIYQNGHHRSYRSGGLQHRSLNEQFANTLQGKLAEFAFYQNLLDNQIACPPPDLSVSGKGIWDSGDFTCGERKISLKSAAFFANLMLFEQKDWDANGRYLPSNQLYHVFVFCRIKPDLKTVFKGHTTISKAALAETLANTSFAADFPGFISRADFRYLAINKFEIKQGCILNERTRIDADNIYIQAGNLRPISQLLPFLV